MPLILPPKSRKMHLRESAFSKFPGGACPRTPLGIACQRHARMRLRPKYPPIIARFPPAKNFSYIPVIYQIQHKVVCLRSSGLEKSAVQSPGQVDFFARQVTFHSHLAGGQQLRQVACLPTKSSKKKTWFYQLG